MRPPFEMISIAPVASALLVALLMASLKTTALVGVAGLTATLLRRASAAVRHLVWSLALLGALGIPLAAYVVPAWPVRWVPALTGAVSPSVRVPAGSTAAYSSAPEPGPAGAARMQTAARLSPEPSASPALPSGPAVRPRVTPPASGIATMSRAPAPRSQSAAPTTSAHAGLANHYGLRFMSWSSPSVSPRAMNLLVQVWLAGVLFLLGRRALASIQLSRLARRSVRVTDPRWRSMLATCARSIGVDRAVTLFVSDEVTVPMTWGTRSPVIVLPRDAGTWAARRRSIVLLHELAHVRRFDTLVLAMAQLASVAYWFNPMVWLAVRNLRNEAERACDDHVLNVGTRASAYAGDLLEIARGAGTREKLASAALAMARRSQLEGRLLAILDPRQPRGSAGRASFACVVLAAIAAMGVLAAVRPAESRLVMLNAAIDPTSPHAQPARPATLPSLPRVPSAAAVAAPAEQAPQVEALSPHVPVAAVPQPSAPDATPETVSVPEPTTIAAVVAPAVLASVVATPAAVAPALVATGTHTSVHKHTQSSWSVNDSGRRKTWNGLWSGNGLTTKVRAEGEIRFTDDYSDIASISDGGYLILEEQRGGHRRRVEIHARSGGLDRAYFLEGVAHPWDAEARAWLATAFIELDRNTGILIDRRFPSLMARGGPNAVLDEITLIPSDYVKGLYFSKLLDANMNRPTMRRAVAQAGSEIESDHELAEVLSKAVQRNALDDEATRAAFLTSVGGLESDYEHARVLMMVVSRKDLSASAAATALNSATHIDSDYERSRVLVALTEVSPLDATAQRAYIGAAGGLDSDYEKGRSLGALVEHGRLSDDNIAPWLAATATVSSDYELANLLVTLAGHKRLDDSARSAYRKAAHAIGSEYDQTRALAALGDQGGQ